MTEKRCRHCGESKPAPLFPQNQRLHDGLDSWCKACHAEAVKRTPSYLAKLRSPTACVTCGTATPATRRYCSPECRPAPPRRARPKATKQCPTCTRSFVAPRADSTYCSRKCQPSYARSHTRRSHTRATHRGICDHCGREYVGRKRKYCTLACGVARWRPIQRQMYRARRLGAWVEIIDPRVVYERDGGICQICRKPVRFGGRKGPNSPAIDHVIPLARGGDHSYANVQLAHARCNSRKHAGPAQLNWINQVAS